MRGKSARLQWERVEAARRQARDDLGDTPPGIMYGPPAKATSRRVDPAVRAGRRPVEAIGVLTLGETAARLGLSRGQLERMIAERKVETLTAGFTRVIAITEVERLARRGKA